MRAAPPQSAWLLLVTGAIGWVASFALVVEDFKLLKNPGYRPSCSFSPILSCGSVMSTHQAMIFGFPNPVIGVAGFAVVITLAVVALVGAVLPRWVWGGLWLGASLGVLFICWLVAQSLYSIGVLCPYCMVVWAIITPVWTVPTQLLWRNSRGGLRILAEWRWAVVALFVAVVVLLGFLRFQDYWLSLL